MKNVEIIKQTTITEQDIIDLIHDELVNVGHLDGMNEKDILQLYSKATFAGIQKHCENDIKIVINQFKTGIEDMELEEFEDWFKFNTVEYLKELLQR